MHEVGHAIDRKIGRSKGAVYASALKSAKFGNRNLGEIVRDELIDPVVTAVKAERLDTIKSLVKSIPNESRAAIAESLKAEGSWRYDWIRAAIGMVNDIETHRKTMAILGALENREMFEALANGKTNIVSDYVLNRIERYENPANLTTIDKFSKTLNYAIAPQDLSELKISVTDLIEGTDLKKVKAVITDKSGKALSASDYELVSLIPATAPEDGSPIPVTYKAKGSNYTGIISSSLRVIAKDRDISRTKTAKSINDQEYTGNAVRLDYNDLNGLLYFGKKGSATLTAGTHFRVSGYLNNVKKGTATVILTGIESKDEKGNVVVYGGTKKVKFKIVQKKGEWKKGGKALVDGSWSGQ